MTSSFGVAPLAGEIAAIPSKSDFHRILIAAALADKATKIPLPSWFTLSEDMEATLGCLTALGATIRKDQDGLQVSPLTPSSAKATTDAFESGSTLRFLLPLAGVLGREVSFSGRGRLPLRPLEPLLSQLVAHGMTFSAASLPFTAAGNLAGGEFSLPGHVSSQFVTGLLFALPLTPEGGRIVLSPPVESKSYIAMTVRTLRTFGIAVYEEENAYIVPGGQVYRSPGVCKVEGDWSNGAVWLCAGAIGGKGIVVSGLSPNSPQGDKAAVSILRRFGANVETEGDLVRVSPRPLCGIAVDAADIPDLSLPLAVVAAFAEGESVFSNMGRLRIKESDRLAGLAAMLNTLCGKDCAKIAGDVLSVSGTKAKGGTFSALGDHRFVMSAAILAAFAENPVIVSGAQAVFKSYPGFFQDYQTLGGVTHELDCG